MDGLQHCRLSLSGVTYKRQSGELKGQRNVDQVHHENDIMFFRATSLFEKMKRTPVSLDATKYFLSVLTTIIGGLTHFMN